MLTGSGYALHLMMGDTSRRPGLDLTQTFRQGQVWRVLTSQFVPSSGLETVLTLLLIYRFRVLERLTGTKRMAALVMLAAASNIIMQLTSLLLGVIPRFASGPTAIIFALLFMYFVEVPYTEVLYRWSATAPAFTNKILVYLISMQLCLLAPASSLLSVGTGLATSLLFMAPSLPLHKLRPLATVVSAIEDFEPDPAWTRAQHTRTGTRRGVGAGRSGRTQAGQATGPGTGSAAGARGAGGGDAYDQQQRQTGMDGYESFHDVGEGERDAVNALEAMGFVRMEALAALRHCDGDVDAAVARLTGQS